MLDQTPVSTVCDYSLEENWHTEWEPDVMNLLEYESVSRIPDSNTKCKFCSCGYYNPSWPGVTAGLLDHHNRRRFPLSQTNDLSSVMEIRTLEYEQTEINFI